MNEPVNQTDFDTNSTQTTPLQRNSSNGSTSSASSVTATTATDTVWLLQLQLQQLTLSYATDNSIRHTAGHFGLDRKTPPLKLKLLKANDAFFSTGGCVLDESFEKCGLIG